MVKCRIDPHKGVLQVLGTPPSRVRDMNEAEVAVSWRGVFDTPRQLFAEGFRNDSFATV